MPQASQADTGQIGQGNVSPRRTPIVMATLGVASCIAASAWWWLFDRNAETTEDAYVAGNVVQVTSLVPGTVVSIAADDTQRVVGGQPLIELDRADSAVALDQAAAQLADAVRQVRALYVNNGTLQATIAQHEADVARARADLQRRSTVDDTGAVSQEDLDHARTTVRAAVAALETAQEQLKANEALTSRTTVSQHPTVQRAAARYREAYLAFARSILPAPVTGFVAQRSVQVGQRVGPGTPLMAVVPLNQVWIDANFKENQLRRMRIGQPVSMSADMYGSRVRFSGRVAGFAAGTGEAFSVLPAQNATGNWIKVVQRLPVRISLDAGELDKHPLRVGLSMQVTVDVRDETGEGLHAVPSLTPLSTNVYATVALDADARIARIIAENVNVK